MSFPKFPHSKDPNDILDYVIDWTARLDTDDTIDTAVYSIVDDGSTTGTDGISIDSQGLDVAKAIVWLSGGIDGTTATLLCRVTTVVGRQMDQTVQLKIKTA